MRDVVPRKAAFLRLRPVIAAEGLRGLHLLLLLRCACWLRRSSSWADREHPLSSPPRRAHSSPPGLSKGTSERSGSEVRLRCETQRQARLQLCALLQLAAYGCARPSRVRSMRESEIDA